MLSCPVLSKGLLTVFILYCEDRSLLDKLSLDAEAEERCLEAADDNIGPVLQVGALTGE